MAPKRHRGEASSSSSAPFDKKKFISAEAADKFDKILAGRSLILERGLRPSETDGDMAVMIRERGWFTFTAHPAPAVPTIVKEFYANATINPDSEVMVRGKTVSYSQHTINACYGLQGFTPCQYSQFVPDYVQIVQELCQPGTTWKRSLHSGREKSFPGKRLSRYGKIWYAFLCAKLLPNTHVSDVSRDRVGLLYAIITGMTIDVGRIIEASIRRKIQGGATSSGLPHPFLITELCERAGVKWGAAEPLQPPTTLLDHNLIQRYQEWSGGLSHPRGLGFIIPPTAEDAPSAPSAPSAPHSSASSSRSHSSRLQQLERQVDRLDDQHHRLAVRQGEMHSYNVKFNTALLRYFQRLNPNVELGNFPTPEGLSSYPPSDEGSTETEDDEAEDHGVDHDD